MANNVSAAIGTARQFGKQPERPYNKQLNNPNFGRGINIGADQGAADRRSGRCCHNMCLFSWPVVSI